MNFINHQIKHYHCFFEMKIFYLMFAIQMHFLCVEAYFRSRLSKFSSSNEKHLTTRTMQKHTNQNSRWIKQSSKCMQPCQLEPYWVSFEKVLKMSGIPFSLHSVIRSKSDMINVGKCVGHCNASIISLYQQPVRKCFKSYTYFTYSISHTLCHKLHNRYFQLCGCYKIKCLFLGCSKQMYSN